MRSTSPIRVRAEHDADAEATRCPVDEPQHLLPPVGVQASGRLVQQHQHRVVHDGLRQLDPLLHAGRVFVDGAIPLLVQAHVAQHVGRAGAGLRGWDATELRHEHEELGGGHVVGETIVFRHVADARPPVRRPVWLLPQDHGGAGRRLDEPEEELHRRALAGAVGPQQPRHALTHLKRHAVERHSAPIVLRQGVCFQKRRHTFRIAHHTARVKGRRSKCDAKRQPIAAPALPALPRSQYGP